MRRHLHFFTVSILAFTIAATCRVVRRSRPELVVKLLAVPAGHHTVWIRIDGQDRYSSTQAQLLGLVTTVHNLNSV
jgi:hypothetical protein